MGCNEKVGCGGNCGWSAVVGGERQWTPTHSAKNVEWMGHSDFWKYRLFEREAVEGEEAANGVLADAVGDTPGRVVIEELEAGFGVGSEARIGLDAVLEFGLEGGILGEVFAGELLKDVGFAVFSLLDCFEFVFCATRLPPKNSNAFERRTNVLELAGLLPAFVKEL